MGYNTVYELHTDDGKTDEHVEAIRDAADYQSFFDGSCKWYGQEKEMCKYSSENPTVEFRLYGQGEESGDVWVKWFKAGKMQVWKLEVNVPTSPPDPW
jgi:hypothetical protein